MSEIHFMIKNQVIENQKPVLTTDSSICFSGGLFWEEFIRLNLDHPDFYFM